MYQLEIQVNRIAVLFTHQFKTIFHTHTYTIVIISNDPFVIIAFRLMCFDSNQWVITLQKKKKKNSKMCKTVCSPEPGLGTYGVLHTKAT